MLLDLLLVLRVDFLELPREIRLALVALFQSFNAENESVVVVGERLNYELNRDFHEGDLDDVLVDDAAKEFRKADQVLSISE